MPPILDVTSLLPTDIEFDMAVDMFVDGLPEVVVLFTGKRP